MDVELLLVDAVAEPVEAHVNSLGSILSDSRVHNAVGGAVVRSDWSWRLRMVQFCQCCSHGDGIFGVHVEGSNFGF